jgi:hypothetical protein
MWVKYVEKVPFQDLVFRAETGNHRISGLALPQCTPVLGQAEFEGGKLRLRFAQLYK